MFLLSPRLSARCAVSNPAMIWMTADQTDPTREATPTDHGWKKTENGLEPDWYPTSVLPECLTASPTNDGDSLGATSTDDEESGNARNEDIDDTNEEDVIRSFEQ